VGAQFCQEGNQRGCEREEGVPMEGAGTSFDEVGAHDHPIARGKPGSAEKQKTEPPGLDFCWEMCKEGGRG
jgi:hypothetical protein